MHELTDSTHLLAEPESLRHRFHDEGYVLLRDVVSKDLLLDVRRDITDVCGKHGWLRADREPMDAIAGVEPRIEGEDPFFEVYDDIQRLESFHAVPHHESVRRCMTPLLGEDASRTPSASLGSRFRTTSGQRHRTRTIRTTRERPISTCAGSR